MFKTEVVSLLSGDFGRRRRKWATENGSKDVGMLMASFI